MALDIMIFSGCILKSLKHFVTTNRKMFDHILWYWYCDNIIGMTIGILTKYEHMKIVAK